MTSRPADHLGWALSCALIAATLSGCGVVDNSGDGSGLDDPAPPGALVGAGAPSGGTSSKPAAAGAASDTGANVSGGSGSGGTGNASESSSASGGGLSAQNGGSPGRAGAAALAGAANAGAPSGSNNGTGSGLPCDVQSFVAAKCQACHSIKPPGLLSKSTDFSAPSTRNPSQTVAELALQRIQATGADRMPPTGLAGATIAEIAAFKAWVDAGAKATACGAPGAPGADLPPNPYGTPVMCSSGTTWRSGEGVTMRPGEACINCHSRDEGPAFWFAGTVYPSAHEPNDCNGVSAASAVSVIITDKNGQEFNVKVNGAGNFSLGRNGSFAYPYRAKVVSGGKERVMATAQMTGDCNGCHTVTGANNAPGRIMAP